MSHSLESALGPFEAYHFLSFDGEMGEFHNHISQVCPIGFQ
jgi:hypothetical protein